MFPGRSYRFFVRLTTGNEDVLTLPAAVGLVQRREELSRPEKVQIARHLEWPETLPSVVCLPKSKFSVDGMVFQDSNWIRVTWDARSAGDGGAKVIVVDRHDPGLVVRQRVEVFSESVFGQSQQHLGIPGGWTLDVCDLHGAEGKTPQPIAPSGPEEWPGYYVNQVVLPTRPLIVDLDPKKEGSSAAKLSDYLNLDDEHRDWREVYGHTVRYLRAWTAFVRSPLNANDPKIQKLIAALPEVFTSLMVGVKTVPIAANAVDSIYELVERATEIRKVLADLQALYEEFRNPQFAGLATPGDRDSAIAFLDVVALAKPGVACLKQRWNHGLQLLVARNDQPPLATEPGTPGGLVRAERFKKLRENYLDPNHEFWPDGFTAQEKLLSQPLLDGSRFEVLGGAAAKLVAKFIDAAHAWIVNAAYCADLAKSVTRGAGISEFLDAWQKSLTDVATLITRPHHQAGVDREADTEAMLLPTELDLFKPDYVPDDEPIEFKDGVWHRDSQVGKGIAVLFNFFERMGFSTDLAGQDALGQPVDQTRLLATLPAVPKDHHLLVCAGVAPYAFLPEQPRVAYDFLHVAVVPTVLLRHFMDFFQSAGQDDDSFKAITSWLDFRRITLSADSRLIVCALAEIVNLVLRVKRQKNGMTLVHVDRRTTSPMPTPLLGTATVAIPIPDNWGHKLDVLVAPLSRYERLQQWLDRGRRVEIPWRDFALRAHEVDLLPATLVDPLNPNDPSPTSAFVCGYAHRTRIQFIYRTSDYGRRALVNRIAEIRTGFRGTDLQFSYAPIDLGQTDLRRWGLVLNGIEPFGGTPIAPGSCGRVRLGKGRGPCLRLCQASGLCVWSICRIVSPTNSRSATGFTTPAA